MVWYGRVWDDDKGDWGHELDDVDTGPAYILKPGAVTGADYREPVWNECEPKYGAVHHRQGCWGGNSGHDRCSHCGFTYQRHHAMVGWCAVGTGGHVSSNGDPAKQRAVVT